MLSSGTRASPSGPQPLPPSLTRRWSATPAPAVCAPSASARAHGRHVRFARSTRGHHGHGARSDIAGGRGRRSSGSLQTPLLRWPFLPERRAFCAIIAGQSGGRPRNVPPVPFILPSIRKARQGPMSEDRGSPPTTPPCGRPIFEAWKDAGHFQRTPGGEHGKSTPSSSRRRAHRRAAHGARAERHHPGRLHPPRPHAGL